MLIKLALIIFTLIGVIIAEKRKALIHSPSLRSQKRLQVYFQKNSDRWELLDTDAPESFMKADIIYKSQYNSGDLQKFQWMNHHPMQIQYNRKGNFKKLMEDFEKSINYIVPSKEIYPETYILSLVEPGETLDERKFFVPENKGKSWIVKPILGRKGKGIYITKDIDNLQKEINAQKPEQKLQLSKDEISFVVQKYIDNPLLINNRKFDIRCYLYFPSYKPMVALYYPGYLRRSIYDYEPDNYDQLKSHLVNVSLQKKDPRYKYEAYESLWMMDKFKNYVVNELKFSDADFQALEEKIKFKLGYIVEALQNFQKKTKQNDRCHRYQIFGVDITIDDQLEPFIIEVNQDPQLDNPHQDVQNHQTQFLESMFAMQEDAMDHVNDQKAHFQQYTQEYINQFQDYRKNFHLIYNEVTNFSYFKNVLNERIKQQIKETEELIKNSQNQQRQQDKLLQDTQEQQIEEEEGQQQEVIEEQDICLDTDTRVEL